MRLENNDLKNKISSNIMGRKNSEINSQTKLNTLKTKLYTMIRTSKKSMVDHFKNTLTK